MSHALVLLSAVVLAFFCLLFELADYGWEQRKRRGLDPRVRSRWFWTWSEQTEYQWYSWVRYLAIILLTYLNALGLVESDRGKDWVLVSPMRLFALFWMVILLSIALLAVDGYWDRRQRRDLERARSKLFWLYFWLRYPALIFATVEATKRGLHS